MQRFLGLLLLWIVAAGPARAARTVAVMPLAAGTSDEAYQGLGTALAGMIVTDLSQVPELQLVERERLGDLLAEIELSRTGFLDPNTAQRLGRGVGAELVVAGSFSVVDAALLVDVRMVAVESGAVVKATNASGPVADFVSVEKEVVEALVEGLAVELSMAVRRRLLAAAPTESLDALARFGRGVEASDEGDLDAARLAFEQAIDKDPAFGLAVRALAELRARVEAAQRAEQARADSSRDRSVNDALAALPSELDRGSRFRDSRDSLVDLSIRWVLLRDRARWCDLFAEQRHFLERTRATVGSIIDRFPGVAHYDRFQAATARYEQRGRELDLLGPGRFVSDGRDLVHEAVYFVGRPAGILTANNLSPEKFTWSMARSLAECFAPAEQETRWVEVLELAERLALLDTPLYTVHGEGPAAVTVGTSMRLYRALLRARVRGGDAEVLAMTEAEVARHPAGDPGRREVLGRVQTIISAAERRARGAERTPGRGG